MNRVSPVVYESIQDFYNSPGYIASLQSLTSEEPVSGWGDLLSFSINLPKGYSEDKKTPVDGKSVSLENPVNYWIDGKINADYANSIKNTQSVFNSSYLSNIKDCGKKQTVVKVNPHVSLIICDEVDDAMLSELIASINYITQKILNKRKG